MRTFYYNLAKEEYLNKKLIYSEIIKEKIDTKSLHIYLLEQGCKVPATLANFRVNVRTAISDAIEMEWDAALVQYSTEIKLGLNRVCRYVVTPTFS